MPSSSPAIGLHTYAWETKHKQKIHLTQDKGDKDVIGDKIAVMLLEDRESFLLPAEKVAHIAPTHTLDHALLVLTNIGYTRIPVLDEASRLKGLLSLPDIIKAATGMDAFDFSTLLDKKVEDIMQTDIPTLAHDFELENALHLLVRHSFLCVTDEAGLLLGIVTRGELLKGTNRVAHRFETVYHVTEKEPIDRETKLKLDKQNRRLQ